MGPLVWLGRGGGIGVGSLLGRAFWVGFMAAARAASHKGRVELPMLFDGFRHAPRSQVALGIVYLACLAAVLGGSALADEGGLSRWMLTGRRPGEEVLQADEFALALVVAAGLSWPGARPLSFAPPSSGSPSAA